MRAFDPKHRCVSLARFGLELNYGQVRRDLNRKEFKSSPEMDKGILTPIYW